MAGCLGLFAWAAVAEKRRCAELRAYAAAHGYLYTEADDSFIDRFHVLPFGQGSNKEALDLVVGSRDGLNFRTFQYRYTVGRGEDSTTRRWQVTWIDLPTALPMLAFMPDAALFRMLGGGGLGDVDVESDEFNRRWRVATRERAYAHAVLAPTMIDAMLAPRLSGCVVFVEGRSLVVAQQRVMELADLDLLLDALVAVRDAVPRFVFEDYSLDR
ncbi:hypothetical protein [Demequina sp. NBRC 110054]|uniref:hypothetical protein n=1 Tax=Demequina sp. NBRC 110054 TaxID=1570343 RepID=UPI0009FDD1E7|nr:hypothetical protein [Demequina sp. NBRC 110054]